MKIRKLVASSVEWRYIYQLLEGIEDENIKNYIANQIQWNVIKASRYRFFEYALNVLTVAMPTVVVVVQHILPQTNPLVQFFVLGSATITTSAGIFLKLHDKRILYRTTAEVIKEETTLYTNKVGKYKGNDRNELFLKKVHSIVRSTNNRWKEIEEVADNASSKEKQTEGNKSLTKKVK